MYNNTVSSEALTTGWMTPAGYNTPPVDLVIVIKRIFNLSEACDCMFRVIYILLFTVCHLNFDFQLVGIQHCRCQTTNSPIRA